MAKINSKQKGSGYELKIAKLLSSWWGEEFHRTPCSGGLKWKEDNRVAGDIVTPTGSIFPFSIECKKREEWKFMHLIKGTGEIEDYWEQCTGDSDRVGLKPMLIFSKNFSPNYFMIRTEDFLKIVEHKNRVPMNFWTVQVLGKESRIVGILDDFIGLVSKEDIIQSYNLNS